MYDKYLINEGDTLESVAHKFNITKSELREINGLKDEFINDCRELLVPKSKEKYFTVYTIEAGDNLYRIAQNYNINPTLLASLNGLDMEEYIYPGQEILIPKSGYSYYITAEGDTLNMVADLFKISLLELINQNETIYLLKDQILISKRN